MGLITKQTAAALWTAYDEIDRGTKLLADMQSQLNRGEDPNPLNAFGRRRNLQLGIPNGDNAQRILDVAPALAMAVINAHIADKRAQLDVLNEQARAELAGPAALMTTAG